MDTWEYKTFETDGTHMTVFEGATFKSDASSEFSSEQNQLKELGSAGWELVAVTLAPAGFYKFFLKRPKAVETAGQTKRTGIRTVSRPGV